MRVLIVGFGSIGKRHYSLLHERGAQLAVVTKRTDIDAKIFLNLEEALEKFEPDLVFICNETHKHWEFAKGCLKYPVVKKIIIEKPIASDLSDELLKLDEASQKRICVAYNFRFSPLLKTLKEELSKQQIRDVVVNVGQDLDQWRDRKGKQTYSGDKSKGGGVLRDLSHELDYIQWIFGSIESVVANIKKTSNLTIDSEDLVHALMRTQKCPSVFLRLSYLDKDPIRIIRVNTDEFTYELNFVKGYLSKNGQKILENKFNADTYTVQADMILAGDYSEFCSYKESLSTLSIISKMENSKF